MAARVGMDRDPAPGAWGGVVSRRREPGVWLTEDWDGGRWAVGADRARTAPCSSPTCFEPVVVSRCPDGSWTWTHEHDPTPAPSSFADADRMVPLPIETLTGPSCAHWQEAARDAVTHGHARSAR